MEQDADIAAAAPNAAASASGPPRPALAPLPEETELRSVVDGVETTEYAVSPQTVAPSEPSSPTGGRKMSAVPKTPRLSTEAKPVVLKINLSTSRMNLLNDDPSLYASPAAFYEKLKEVANTSELAGLLAQGDSSFHEELRRLLLSEFDFSGMSVDESLRDLLETFELPKESQQIDRIVGAFAAKYHEDNPEVFESADSAHILTFSLLMLNTDLHSPHVKRKMTPADFINNTRFGPAARSLPTELLEVLYENVASVEFRMGPTTGEQGEPKRKNWGLGRTAKKLGLKKTDRPGGKPFGSLPRTATASSDPFGVPVLPLERAQTGSMDAKRTLQKMFSWAKSGTLKRKMGWVMGGDMQSAESALDAVEHLLGLSHRAAFIPSLSLGASRRQSGVFEVTGGILAATALTLPESSSVKSENNSSLALDAAVKRLSVNQYPPLDARTSESSSTFINSARSSSSLHRTSLSSTLGRLSGHRPSLSVSSRSSVMGSRSGSFLSTTASASYAQPPASMLDSNTTLLHARLNVKKVSHSNNVSSRPGPEPGPGILPSSSSTSIHSLALSTDGNGNGTAAEDVGNWPLTWVALSNTGTLTLFNPATRKTTVLALEGAVAVWDPWFYRPENEDEEEVPKAAPGCWHLWLPSPPYTKDYIIKGEHAREWVDAVNSASASAFFSTPAAQKVTVDQLCALVRIQNDKLASVRNVLLHMSLMKPLSGRSKKKVMEIVARKWVEARDAKRERERYAVLLSELEKRGGVGGPVRYGTI